jgi:hypothetical protein
MPDEAKGTSAASAKAFAEHYFDLINYAADTGETARLESASDPGCQSCHAISTTIAGTYDKGGRIETDGWLVQSVKLVPLQSRSKPILDLGVFLSPERVVPSRGAKAQQYDGGKQPMTMYLQREKGTWLVSRLDRVT